MKILIIYDTYFGNTQKVASDIGRFFKEENHEVILKSVKETDVSELRNIDLLVIGSPTRAFKPTKDIVAFIKKIDKDIASKVKFAVFDTRMDVVKINNKFLSMMVKCLGFADSTMMKILNKKGGQCIVDSRGFLVDESEGPLNSKVELQAREFVKEILKVS